MAASLFARTLSTAEMEPVFSDAALIGAMLEFETALAVAEAAEGLIPASAAQAITAACRVDAFDIEAIVVAARRAGTIVVPLIEQLRARVAERHPGAAAFVHRGSTSQDVIDTAMVLATRKALALMRADHERLIASLFALARLHANTPTLARTLMQPAQVISFGFKVVSWLAPLVRARGRLASAAAAALQLQLGGAVGTLAGLDEKGAAVAARVGAHLGLPVPAGAWHVQRDSWVGLGCEVALLCGSLGKIGTDLALLTQFEVGELSEPGGPGRGTSSALPHKRNPVAALVAIAAATQAPQQAATLLAAMAQEHERSLGHWQAELAQWPALFLSAHGALRALADACAGLEVHAAAMRGNIDAHLHAVGAGATSASVDVEAEARRAGAQALAQLELLQPLHEGSRP